MKESQHVKIIVYVPESHTEVVRKTMGDAGAGKIGNYTHCSFTAKGEGRFLPMDGSNPAIGEVGKLEVVNEARIEMICDTAIAESVIMAMKSVHPYEEVAYEVFPLLEL